MFLVITPAKVIDATPPFRRKPVQISELEELRDYTRQQVRRQNSQLI